MKLYNIHIGSTNLQWLVYVCGEVQRTIIFQRPTKSYRIPETLQMKEIRETAYRILGPRLRGCWAVHFS